MLATILHLFGEDEGWKLFGRILPNLVITNSSGRVGRGTADGEYTIGLSVESVGQEYIAGGAPIKIVYPKPATAATPNGVALVRGATNPGGAKQFIDFVLSKPGQQILVDGGRRGVRNDVPPPAGLLPLSDIPIDNYKLSWAASNRERMLKQYLRMLRQ
jgi:iron(III) transport system substrate-binding protein